MTHFGKDKKFMHMVDERTGKFIPLHGDEPPVWMQVWLIAAGLVCLYVFAFWVMM